MKDLADSVLNDTTGLNRTPQKLVSKNDYYYYYFSCYYYIFYVFFCRVKSSTSQPCLFNDVRRSQIFKFIQRKDTFIRLAEVFYSALDVSIHKYRYGPTFLWTYFLFFFPLFLSFFFHRPDVDACYLGKLIATELSAVSRARRTYSSRDNFLANKK